MDYSTVLEIKQHLHHTKGWRKGAPRGRKMPRAVVWADGTLEVDIPKTKKARKTGGMFTIRKKV